MALQAVLSLDSPRLVQTEPCKKTEGLLPHGTVEYRYIQTLWFKLVR
jgi:hypothetical protein